MSFVGLSARSHVLKSGFRGAHTSSRPLLQCVKPSALKQGAILRMSSFKHVLLNPKALDRASL